MPNNIDTHAALSSQGFAQQTQDSLGGALGGLSPFNDFGKYMTGSRAIIKLNDKLFGFAFGVSFNIETLQEEIRTIDDYTAYELAPNQVKVSGTLSMFHIPGKGPTPELIQPNILAFLFHKYITIRIEDQTTGQKIFETNRAQIISKRQSLRAGELSTIELQWKALGWTDQQKPFYPDGADTNLKKQTGNDGLVSQISKVFG